MTRSTTIRHEDHWPHMPMDQWSKEWSTILSSFYAGALIGFIMVPYLIRAVGGVRNSLLWSSIPAVLGCLVQLFVRYSSTNIIFDLILSFGRLLVGIQSGCSLCLLPLFIIETSTFAHRSFLSSLQQVFQSLATLIGLVVGSETLLALGLYKLEWLQIISLTPSIIFVLLLLWLPETPFHLLEKCQTDECIGREEDLELEFERSALFYYGIGVDFSAIRHEAFYRWRIPLPMNDGKHEKRNTKKQQPFVDNLKGLLIGILASISFTFTADDLIDSYSAEFLYRSSDAADASVEMLSAMLGLLLFLTSIIGALLVDQVGRRRLLLISGLVGTAISNAIAAIGAALNSELMVVIGFAFTKAFIGFGAGAPAWFLTSELVSPLVVAEAQAISTGSLLITTGLSTLCFLSLQVWVGSAAALLFLSSMPALFIAFLLFLMLPETRNLPFEQVYQLLRTQPLPGLARHPKWSRVISPLFENDESAKSTIAEWDKNWEFPHRSQRLMSSYSYISYGSIHSSTIHGINHNNNDSVATARPFLSRRHSAIPATDQHHQNETQHRLNNEFLIVSDSDAF